MQAATGQRAGWIGAGIGYCAWSVVLTVVAMLSGAWGFALEVGLPCLLLSIAAWQLTVLAVLCGHAVFGPASPEARAVRLGSMFGSLGILLFAANEYALPAALEHEGMRRVLAATGSAIHLPAIVEWSVLALGIGLLAAPVLGVLRRRA